MSLVDGRFELERLLGSGGFGEAHLARDRDGRAVVVKLLHARHTSSATVTERFRREVVALEKLVHRNVVGLVAHGSCPLRGPYYAMEFSPGASLDQLLGRNGPLPQADVLSIMDQLFAALEAAHALGIFHRDLKPGNLLLEEPGADGARFLVRVIDFGLAKHTQGGLQTKIDLTGNNIMGTPSYMAPEQCQGKPTSPKTDIYAAGCIFMELLSGKVPFLGKDAVALLSQHVAARAPRLDDRVPGAPRLLVDLVDACLHKTPSERPDAVAARRVLALIAPKASAERAPPISSPAAFNATTMLDAATVGGEVTGIHHFATGETTLPPKTFSGATAGGVAASGPGELTIPPRAPLLTAPKPPRGELEVGDSLGGFRLEKKLGEGGFGRVFETRLADGRKAALKVLLRADPGDKLDVEKRFQREIRLLRSLEHPAFPQVYATGIEDGIAFAVIELIPGQDLADLLAREKRLPIARLLPILREIIPALDLAHSKGVIHCDLKPGNIRIRDDGRAFLLDLGIAKIRDGSSIGGRSIQTAQGLIFGTLGYFAPELLQGRDKATPETDIYALGVLLYECVAGLLPFLEQDPFKLVAAHQSKAPPQLSILAPDVPVVVADTILKCLAKKPKDRPHSAGAVLAALEKSRLRTARLGTSRDPLADSGDALRAKLEVEFEGQKGVLFLFAGTRLRFGRNSNRGPQVENDLVLRAFPRPREDPRVVEKRTRDMSGHHGTFLLTADGIAVRDDGSTIGTTLDGVPLPQHKVTPLKDQFVLEVARVLALRGKVIRSIDGATGERLPGVDASHPVEALRLERTRDGEHMSYVLLVREALIGAGEDDAVFLPHPAVKPGHARIAFRSGRYAIGALRADAPVAVAGKPVRVGGLVDLDPGVEVTLGTARLLYTSVRDEDMKPIV